MSQHYSDILAQLISFNSISNNSNIELIDYIQELLRGKGYTSTVYFNAEKNKANLIATLGPQNKKGLVLAGHTDVVPVVGQDWHSDPFVLTSKDGRYYGRGTCDMKGFLALALAEALAIDESQLNAPLSLVFTYDEEVGCFGAKALKNQLSDLAGKAEFAIIGEPSNMALVNAHKGIQTNETIIKGKPAHSSAPSLGASAILAASELIAKIPTILPRDSDKRFNPDRATFNIGMLNGGNAVNIIAEHCKMAWEFRVLPTADFKRINDSLTQEIDELTSTLGVTIHNQAHSLVPGLTSKHNSEAIRYLRSFFDETIDITTAAFVTEAGIFDDASIPTVVFGPGEIEQAHQPNESVSETSMDDYQRFLSALTKAMLY